MLIIASQPNPTATGSYHWLVSPERNRKHQRQHKADNGPGNGNPELIGSIFTVLVELRNAAKDEQGDGADRYTPLDGDQAVAKLVGHNRGKERQCGETVM